MELNDEEKKLKQKFISFLKENNAYYEFRKEFTESFINFYNLSGNKKTNDYSFNYFISYFSKNEYGFIYNAFGWDNTNSHNLWLRLSRDERKLIRK